jgi:hypothetical protein
MARCVRVRTFSAHGIAVMAAIIRAAPMFAPKAPAAFDHHDRTILLSSFDGLGAWRCTRRSSMRVELVTCRLVIQSVGNRGPYFPTLFSKLLVLQEVIKSFEISLRDTDGSAQLFGIPPRDERF